MIFCHNFIFFWHTRPLPARQPDKSQPGPKYEVSAKILVFLIKSRFLNKNPPLNGPKHPKNEPDPPWSSNDNGSAIGARPVVA